MMYLLNMSEKDYIRKKNKWYEYLAKLINPQVKYGRRINGMNI